MSANRKSVGSYEPMWWDGSPPSFIDGEDGEGNLELGEMAASAPLLPEQAVTRGPSWDDDSDDTGLVLLHTASAYSGVLT
jgi:hypothetical protein